MSKEELYTILEIPKTATDDEIKKTKSINCNHLVGCNIRYHPRQNSNIEGDAKRI